MAGATNRSCHQCWHLGSIFLRGEWWDQADGLAHFFLDMSIKSMCGQVLER